MLYRLPFRQSLHPVNTVVKSPKHQIIGDTLMIPAGEEGYVIDTIYDNEGATIDRFTISVAFEGERKRLIRASAVQSSDKGIFEVEMGEHPYQDDKRISWDDLPEDLRFGVVDYCRMALRSM